MKMITLIQKEFDEKGIHSTLDAENGVDILHAGFSLDYGMNVDLSCYAQEDNSDVSIRLYSILNVKHINASILKVLNDCNDTYHFFKFVLDEDQDLVICYDFTPGLDTENLGNIVFELCLHILNVAQEVYPDFMRAIWGNAKNEDSKENRIVS